MDYLENFLGEEKAKKKKILIDNKEGLIEKLDKTFVTKDGKELLQG